MSQLPGSDLVDAGLRDLERGIESPESLLVEIGAPRLRQLGVDIPRTPTANPEHRLYELLSERDPAGAHSRYNALLRRLVSYERARACAS